MISRFAPAERFQWHNTTYTITRAGTDGQVNIQDDRSQAMMTCSVRDLEEELFAARLVFVETGRHVKATLGPDTGTERVFVSLDDCAPRHQEIAVFRLECIKPLLEITRAARTRACVERRAHEVTADLERRWKEATDKGEIDTVSHLPTRIGAWSLYRWLLAYIESGCDIGSLIPDSRKSGGQGDTRLPAPVATIVDDVIKTLYLVAENKTTEDVLHEVAVRIKEANAHSAAATSEEPALVCPCRRTVARRIEALDLQDRYAAKHSKRATKMAFTQFGTMEAPTTPLERVEIDHTLTDLIVVDDTDHLPLGRLTFTIALDRATRYPLGYYLGFEPPSYLSVLECLYHAIWRKEDTRLTYGTDHAWLARGVPATLVVDNGREFTGKDLRDACLQLGITLQRTPVRMPHLKGGVERVLKTISTGVFHTLPGTTFSTTRERKERDYNSAAQACVYLSDVDRILTTYLIDIYAETLHRGLKGIPARRWEEATRFGFYPRLPSNPTELRILLGRVDSRVVEHYGIEFTCLYYQSPDLVALRTKLHGEKAKIKWHPGDLSKIYVHDPWNARYIEVPAQDQEYTRDLSFWKHRVILNAARKEAGKVNAAALGRAKRRIQEIVEEGRRRRSSGTKAVGRWETGGAPARGAATDTVTTQPEDAPGLPPLSAAVLSVLDGDSDDMDGWEVDAPPPRTEEATTTEGDATQATRTHDTTEETGE